MTDVGAIANQFEDLIIRGQIGFHPSNVGHLDMFSQLVIQTFLTDHQIGWTLGDRYIGKAICIKVEDSYLQFLDIYPEQMKFQWCTDNHTKGVFPDEAVRYLLKKTFPNMEIEILPNGTIKVGGLTILPK